MRLSTLGLLAAGGLLLASAPGALAQAPAQNMARTTQPLTRALAEMRRLYGTEFVFEERLLAGKTTAVQVTRGRSVEELLKAMLYPNGLLFLYVDKNHYTIVARDGRAEVASPGPAAGAVTAQTRTISGQVRDEKGDALPGATVLVGTSGQVGVASDTEGRFTLEIPANVLAMKVSSIGYETRDILITAAQSYAITLQSQATNLNERWYRTATRNCRASGLPGPLASSRASSSKPFRFLTSSSAWKGRWRACSSTCKAPTTAFSTASAP